MAITFEEVTQTVINLVKANEQLRMENEALKKVISDNANAGIAQRVREPDAKPMVKEINNGY